METKKLKYQLILVLDPALAEKEREALFKKIGDKFEKKEHLGVKEMRYKIKDLEKGDYWIFETETEKPIQMKEFNIYLNREVKIIRYLLLKRR
jgi:ribosomal protein S6